MIDVGKVLQNKNRLINKIIRRQWCLWFYNELQGGENPHLKKMREYHRRNKCH